MSDTEAQNKTEEVKMDAPAQEETTEAAPAVETKEVKEDAPAAAESSNAAEEKTNGNDKEAEKMEVEANGQEEAAADETKEEDAPAPKKPKSKTAGPSSRRNGAKAAPSDNATFKTGDVVLARVKGYPFWRESRMVRFGRCAGTDHLQLLIVHPQPPWYVSRLASTPIFQNPAHDPSLYHHRLLMATISVQTS